MKRFFKNRFLVLIVSVIIISGVYIAVQKAIDNNFFRTNSDIISSSNGETVGATDFSANASDKNSNNDGDNANKKEGDSDTKNSIVDDGTDVLNEENSISEDIDNEEGMDNNSEENSKVDLKSSKIYIYITGEVNNPRCCYSK